MVDLSQIPLFAGLPQEELAWLQSKGREEFLRTGDYFFEEGGPANHFYVTLEGELQVSRNLYGHETVLGTTPRGVMGGELSLLHGTPSQVSARAIMPTRLLVFDEPQFRQIFAACPAFAARILRVVGERTQGLASNLSQRDLMAALGKLSAGLAHELNNPAAAARRAARELADSLPSLQTRSMEVASLGLSAIQLHSLIVLQRDAIQNPERSAGTDPLEQSAQEDEIADWLDGVGAEDSWEMAPVFVAAGVKQEDLEVLAERVPEASLPTMLSWLCSALFVANLLDEIEQTTTRISELVGAVKAYTYMDQAPVQELDVNQGLENTVTVMKHKLRDVAVIRNYDPELPRIVGRGAELNQVWTNLVDNAVDAMQGRGTLWLITRCENEFVMVEVTDDGPGIPDDALNRIFEPFFTTKGVGEGTGLGLDITYRIIRQHLGTIEVRRDDDRTRFIVRLPIDGVNNL